MEFGSLQTLLFAPASRPERFAKALASGADAVVVDLEDAIAPADKDNARAALATWLSTQPRESVLVRINGITTRWFDDDVALCRSPAVAGVVVPKAEQARELTSIGGASGKSLLPLVESAPGLANLSAVAAGAGVVRLLFGKLDLAVDLGMDYPPPAGDDPDESAFLFVRSQLVLASRCAGLPPPIDGVFTALDDEQGLQKYARRGALLGFGGMLVIHPRQIGTVRLGYAASPGQVAWAEKVMRAAELAGGAATSVDGAMVDAPVIARARQLLASARGT